MCAQQRSIISWKKQAKKKNGQYMVMNQWLKVKQESKNLALYFAKNQYKRIAICGMNHIGKRLLNELRGSDIEVIYGIDRNAENISADIRIVTLEADIPNVDAVVVTLAEGFYDVYDALVRKVQCPILSIEDILNEI